MPVVGLSLLPGAMMHTDVSAVYVARGALVAADSIVLALTWTKTFGSWNNARKLSLERSIFTCLLRDGK